VQGLRRVYTRYTF
jgi:hypothetical protein